MDYDKCEQYLTQMKQIEIEIEDKVSEMVLDLLSFLVLDVKNLSNYIYDVKDYSNQEKIKDILKKSFGNLTKEICENYKNQILSCYDELIISKNNEEFFDIVNKYINTMVDELNIKGNINLRLMSFKEQLSEFINQTNDQNMYFLGNHIVCDLNDEIKFFIKELYSFCKNIIRTSLMKFLRNVRKENLINPNLTLDQLDRYKKLKEYILSTNEEFSDLYSNDFKEAFSYYCIGEHELIQKNMTINDLKDEDYIKHKRPRVRVSIGLQEMSEKLKQAKRNKS